MSSKPNSNTEKPSKAVQPGSDTALLNALALYLTDQPPRVRQEVLSQWAGALSGEFQAVCSKLVPEFKPSKVVLKDAGQQLQIWKETYGISTLFFWDEAYPQMLRQIYSPPPVLFVRGDSIEYFNRIPMIGLVGSRRADPAALEFAESLGRSAAKNGNCVVSGLALGIDGRAHAGALQSDFIVPTIAVFGCGLDTVYPRSHIRLAESILRGGGMLVSQFPPGTQAYPANFLDRNRVIAGLSLGVVVVQAARRSGALSTARHALEAGRDVLAVPGSPWSKAFAGCNNLIQQGAGILTDISDLYQYINGLNQTPCPDAPEASTYSADENKVLACLRSHGPMLRAELENQLGSCTTASSLLALEMRGVIKVLPGNQLMLSE